MWRWYLQKFYVNSLNLHFVIAERSARSFPAEEINIQQSEQQNVLQKRQTQTQPETAIKFCCKKIKIELIIRSSSNLATAS